MSRKRNMNDSVEAGQIIPTPRQLQIAIEQPAEADTATLAYLDKHPAVRQILERARKLEMTAQRVAKENPRFDWDRFVDRLKDQSRSPEDDQLSI